MFRHATILLSFALVAALATGCGSAKPSTQSNSTAAAPAGSATAGAPATPAKTPSVGALSAEATSAATGDIPDTQVFLSYKSAGYAISFPEGWTRNGTGSNVTFSDKNNLIHIVINPAGAASPASLSAELARLKQSQPTLTFTSPRPIRLRSGPAVKATYTTLSPPNPVTGKRVLLVVDRYELAKGSERATVDLATAKGVDNVDAYRLIANSFRWS